MEVLASGARYRQLIETLNVVPFELDPKRGRFSYVGPQIERVLGHAPESCLADGFWAGSVAHDFNNLLTAILGNAAVFGARSARAPGSGATASR